MLVFLDCLLLVTNEKYTTKYVVFKAKTIKTLEQNNTQDYN
jgi:hypothetical protein